MANYGFENVYNLFWFHQQAAEEQLKKEANLTDIPDNVPVDSDVSSVLAAYKSEGDPDLYDYAYMELRRFVDESLDIYKVIITHIQFLLPLRLPCHKFNPCFFVVVICSMN